MNTPLWSKLFIIILMKDRKIHQFSHGRITLWLPDTAECLTY